jgi:hypothetical protein
VYCSMALRGGSFYSAKGPKSRWTFIWKALVVFYPRVHRTVRCTPDTVQCNSYESLDWLLSASGASICLVGAPDCSVLLLIVGSGGRVK